MKKIKRYIGAFLKYGTLLSTLALVFSVVIQIYARFFMENAPSWTEEASRVFFIYAISFASGRAFRQHYFVSLDLISNKLNPKLNTILELIVNLLVFLLFLILAIYAIPYMIMGTTERSPSLGFNMSISFASILLMAAAICFYSALNIFQLSKRLV